jgi:hypothetical protein
MMLHLHQPIATGSLTIRARLRKEAARNAQKADKTAVGENLLKFPIFSYIRV